MAITRFQEIPDCTSSSALSAVCFEEISKLHKQGEDDTGCLMVLPNLSLDDCPNLSLDDWVEKNVAAPLESLGVSESFTLTTYSDVSTADKSKSPHHAIRLLHRLTDAPIKEGGMTDEEVDRKVDEMYERAERQVREKRRREREKKERKEKKKKAVRDRPGGGGFGDGQ